MRSYGDMRGPTGTVRGTMVGGLSRGWVIWWQEHGGRRSRTHNDVSSVACGTQRAELCRAGTPLSSDLHTTTVKSESASQQTRSWDPLECKPGCPGAQWPTAQPGPPVAMVIMTENTGLAGREEPSRVQDFIAYRNDNTSTHRWLKNKGKLVAYVTGKARGKGCRPSGLRH